MRSHSLESLILLSLSATRLNKSTKERQQYKVMFSEKKSNQKVSKLTLIFFIEACIDKQEDSDLEGNDSNCPVSCAVKMLKRVFLDLAWSLNCDMGISSGRLQSRIIPSVS